MTKIYNIFGTGLRYILLGFVTFVMFVQSVQAQNYCATPTSTKAFLQEIQAYNAIATKKLNTLCVQSQQRVTKFGVEYTGKITYNTGDQIADFFVQNWHEAFGLKELAAILPVATNNNIHYSDVILVRQEMERMRNILEQSYQPCAQETTAAGITVFYREEVEKNYLAFREFYYWLLQADFIGKPWDVFVNIEGEENTPVFQACSNLRERLTETEKLKDQVTAETLSVPYDPEKIEQAVKDLKSTINANVAECGLIEVMREIAQRIELRERVITKVNRIIELAGKKELNEVEQTEANALTNELLKGDDKTTKEKAVSSAANPTKNTKNINITDPRDVATTTKVDPTEKPADLRGAPGTGFLDRYVTGHINPFYNEIYTPEFGYACTPEASAENRLNRSLEIFKQSVSQLTETAKSLADDTGNLFKDISEGLEAEKVRKSLQESNVGVRLHLFGKTFDFTTNALFGAKGSAESEKIGLESQIKASGESVKQKSIKEIAEGAIVIDPETGGVKIDTLSSIVSRAEQSADVAEKERENEIDEIKRDLLFTKKRLKQTIGFTIGWNTINYLVKDAMSQVAAGKEFAVHVCRKVRPKKAEKEACGDSKYDDFRTTRNTKISSDNSTNN